MIWRKRRLSKLNQERISLLLRQYTGEELSEEESERLTSLGYAVSKYFKYPYKKALKKLQKLQKSR